ncbi:DNA primase [Candidatus Nitronereus thalassa]|uniref:DNA primase n=1 Tax=Candidatus Nitronereus thalassa TaxID=3020898 RepID=A0ABU3KAH8_9BACT|nr:DNA primase [Candidatus Nitronereus thalassa]MDT7043431.1 DNA primase [Candidatus Nitronereus thalassa]
MATDRGGIPPTTLQQIRDTVDIVDVVSRYVTLSKVGQNHRGLCPFHNEKTPSFNVNPGKQMFYCFGCGTGGDVFSFLMNRERFSFVEAVNELAQQAGIELPTTSIQRTSGFDRDQRKTLEHLHRLAHAWFQQNLHESTQGQGALTYLQDRGLALDTVKDFGVGYALPSWDGLLHYLCKNGAKAADLLQAGLVVAKQPSTSGESKRDGYYDRFRSRVMVPIMDLRGNVIAFGGRILEEGTPKYLNSPETPLFNKGRNLFGMDRAREAASQLNNLLIVEGYFDVMVLHQHGIRHAVAPLGTALTAEHVSLLRRFVKNVVLMFDGDAAGLGATLRTMDVFINTGVTVKVVRLPAGEDPDSYVRAHGGDQVLALQQQARPLVEFAVEQCLEGATKASVEERTRRVDDVLRILAKVSHPIEKEEYFKQVAERLGISQSLLMQRSPVLLARQVSRDSRQQSSPNLPARGRVQDQKGSREERDLVTLLIQGMIEPDQILALRPEDFLNPEYRRLVTMSLAHVNQDGVFDSEALLAEAAMNQDFSALVAQLSVSEQHFDDCRDYVKGCLNVLERRRLKTTLDELIARLRIAEREHHVEQIAEINAEIDSLREQKAGLAISPQA